MSEMILYNSLFLTHNVYSFPRDFLKSIREINKLSSFGGRRKLWGLGLRLYLIALFCGRYCFSSAGKMYKYLFDAAELYRYLSGAGKVYKYLSGAGEVYINTARLFRRLRVIR